MCGAFFAGSKNVEIGIIFQITIKKHKRVVRKYHIFPIFITGKKDRGSQKCGDISLITFSDAWFFLQKMK